MTKADSSQCEFAIRFRAWLICEARMRANAPGDALSDWLQAEREVQAARDTPQQPPQPIPTVKRARAKTETGSRLRQAGRTEAGVSASRVLPRSASGLRGRMRSWLLSGESPFQSPIVSFQPPPDVLGRMIQA
jgi:hypothetical protein